jgi:hypothetical protein
LESAGPWGCKSVTRNTEHGKLAGEEVAEEMVEVWLREGLAEGGGHEGMG